MATCSFVRSISHSVNRSVSLSFVLSINRSVMSENRSVNPSAVGRTVFRLVNRLVILSVGPSVRRSGGRSSVVRSFSWSVSRSPHLLVGQSVGHSDCHLVGRNVVMSVSKSVGKLFVHSFVQTFGCHSAVVRYRSSFQLGGRSALALSVCRSVFRSTNGSVSRSVILTIGQPVCRVSQFVVQSIGPSVN